MPEPLLPDALKALWTEGATRGVSADALTAEQERLMAEYVALWTDALVTPGERDLRESLVHEIREVTGMADRAEIARRLATAVADVSDEWRTHVADPTERGAIERFYDQSRAYIFDLMAWHSLRDDNGPLAYVVALRFAEQRGCRTYLDFGAGVGSGALLFARHGFDVTLADISSTLLAFARGRFARRGVAASFVDLRDHALPAARFDIVTAMDVWEHLADPVQTATDVARAIKPGGYLFGRFAAEPDPDRPQHIVLDFEPTFRRLADEGFTQIWRDEWLWGHQAFQKHP